MRRFPPIVDGEIAVFAMLNRGKQVMTFDLTSDVDREKLIPVIQRAESSFVPA